MRTFFISLLFIALAAYGQTLTSVAVLPSDRTDSTVLNNDELEVLTDKMRQAALKVLPADAFVLLKQDVVIKRLGGFEQYVKECTESSCIVNLGKKAQVDYVSQASVGKLGNKLRLKIELYNVYTEGLVSMLSDEKSENVEDLLAIVESRVPDEVFGKIPVVSGDSKAEPPMPKLMDVSNSQAPAPKPKSSHAMLALALDIAGVALISAGIAVNANVQKSLDKYGKIEEGPEYYEDAWADVKSGKITRNMLYVVGGLVLASGIGVHIWF